MKWPLIVPLVALGVLTATFLVHRNAALLLALWRCIDGAVIPPCITPRWLRTGR